MRISLFPGTFDPPTNGHLDLIVRAAQLSDKLIVAVAEQHKGLFTSEERVELLKQIVPTIPHLEIVHFQGLVSDFARECNASSFIRGLRTTADFDYEHQMAFANRRLCGLETLFLTADPTYAQISSTLIREIAVFKDSLKDFVPEKIESAILKRCKEKLG